MKVLDPQSVLSPGCDLWMVTEPSRSAWARRIDWYLNFQMNRATTHRTPEISPELRKVMEKWEVDAPEVEVQARAPLLIGSSKLLPNNKTVLVPESPQAREWVEDCHRIWSSLGKPSTRVFLPDEMKPSDFEAGWPALDHDANVEIVPHR